MGKTAFTGTPKTLPKFITEEEVLAILSKSKKHRYRNYILILILWRTGMRVSEALKLQKKDIAEDSIMVRQGKGKKDRVNPHTKRCFKSSGALYGSYEAERQAIYNYY